MKKRNQIKGAAAILACMLAVEAGAYHSSAAYAQNAETELADETETEIETEPVETEEIVETEKLPEETEAVETEAVETEMPETEVPETKASETKAPETEKAAETEAAKEEKAKAENTNEKKGEAAEKKAVEDETADTEQEEYEQEADLKADVENEVDWEKTLPKKFAHEKKDAAEADYRADIVAIAKSQINYQESERNFVLTKSHEKVFWNRYGAWAGDAYANPWDAEFIAFVLDYAGLTDVPLENDTAKWTHKLAKEDLYFDTSYKAEAGDIVFLQEKDGTFHPAIITDVKEQKGANELTVVGATVGEERNFVKKEKIAADDDRIVAYSPVAKTTAEPVKEAETEKDTDKAASNELKSEKKQEKTINVKVYTDELQKQTQSDVIIQVSGNLPDGAAATAWPVQEKVDGEETYAAYRLLIKDKEGNEIHSDAKDDIKITVTIQDASLTKALLGNENAHGWRGDNGALKDMAFTLLPDGGVQFDADIF